MVQKAAATGKKWQNFPSLLLGCSAIFVGRSHACFFLPPRRVQRWSSLAELLLPASSLTRNTRRRTP